MQCGAIRGFVLFRVIRNSLKSLNIVCFQGGTLSESYAEHLSPRLKLKSPQNYFPPIHLQSLCNYLYSVLFFPQRKIPQDSIFNNSEIPAGRLLRTSLWEQNIIVTAIVTNASDSQACLGQVLGEIEDGQNSCPGAWKIPCDTIASGGKPAGQSPG